MDSAVDESVRTLGPLLQEARTVKGLTIEAAAAASKVPLSFVRLLEQEQFHLVPDPIYLTRFLTEYATFLDLDPRQIEVQLKDQINAARASEPPHPVSSIGLQVDLRRLLMYLLPAAAVIPIIFIGLSLFSGQPPALPPESQPELPASQDTVAPLPEAITAVPPDSHTPSLSTEQPVGVTKTTPIASPAAQELQGPPPRYRLTVEAKETTWLGVSADGASRKQALLRPGEKAQWSANNGFVITIGNAKGVALSLNGRPIPLKETPGQVIRDLALPGDGGPPLAGQ